MKTIIILSALTLSACASPKMHYVSTSYAAGGVSINQAEAKCDYESSSSTQATDYSYRSGLAQEIDRNLRKNKLMEMCMKAQGFVLHI